MSSNWEEVEVNIEEAFEQGIYNFMNAPILLYPFPHLFLKDLFPIGLYKKILSYFPSEKEMKTLQELERGDYENRLLFPLTSPFIEKLEGNEKLFWEKVCKLFFSQKFYLSVMKKLGMFLDKNKLKLLGLKNIIPRIDLIEDQEHYALSPHTDNVFDLLTLLFYLPEDELHPDWGTSLYVPKKEIKNLKPYEHYERENFFEIKKFPFAPNSVLAFVRSDHSFHGVEAIEKGTERVKRRLLIYTLKGFNQ